MKGTVAGLLLAAGGGSRYGQPKALVTDGGELLVERGVRLLAEAGCTPVIVVLGAAAGEVTAAASLGSAVVVVNPDWASGIGSSLRAGLAAAPATAAGALVALVDQPEVTVEAARRVLGAAARPGAAAVVATYGGRPGHPVLLPAATWAEVAAGAAGDTGARAYLRAHEADVVRVPCDDVGVDDDVDTPQDLARIRARRGGAAAGEPGPGAVP